LKKIKKIKIKLYDEKILMILLIVNLYASTDSSKKCQI